MSDLDLLTAITSTFKRMDVRNEGMIEAHVMKQCFREVLNFSEDDISDLFAAYPEASNLIRYKEFLEFVFSDCGDIDSELVVEFDFLPDDPEHLASLEKEFGGYFEIADTAHRGITLVQLARIISFAKPRATQWKDTSRCSKTYGNSLDISMLNLYHLNAWVIMPSTKKRNCAFVELVASTKQTPTWFVSHWWGEQHLDFVNCVNSHIQLRGLPQGTCYWVCAYANRQHSLKDEVVTDPRKSSFYRAIRLCTGILLVLDDAKPFSGPATPFTRIWCAFEESVALDQDDDMDLMLDIACYKDKEPSILTHGRTDAENNLDEVRYFGAGAKAKMTRESKFPLEIIAKGLEAKLENAEASVESDRNHILNVIAGISSLNAKAPESHPAYTAVNQTLRGVFARAAWPQAVQKDMVSFLNLPRVLASDSKLIALSLSFAASTRMGGKELSLLGQGLPANLKALSLDFTKCLHVGDAGLTSLSRCFPKNLERLQLLLRHCWQISDKGLATLSSNLPESLKSIDINAANCDAIQDMGLDFSGSVLTSVTLNFDHCEVLSDRSLAVLANSLSRSLSDFRLSLQGCSAITEVGLAALGHLLPKELRDLQIRGSFSHTNDVGLASLAPAVANNTSLRVLTLDFFGCPKINDTGVVALTKTLPIGLTSFTLRVDGCGPISSQGIAAVAKGIARMRNLKYLWLPVDGTIVDDSGAVAVQQSLPSGLDEFQLGEIYWHNPYLSQDALNAFQSLESIRGWRPSVRAAEPSAQEANPLGWNIVKKSLPPPIGTSEPLDISPLIGSLEAEMVAELNRKLIINHVESLSLEQAIINIPKPCKNLEADTDDDRPLRFDITGLMPMQLVQLHFSGIHNEKYIGIHTLRVFTLDKEIDYKVSTTGKGSSTCKNVLPAVANWWAVPGDEHDLFLDLGAVEKITEIALFCPNESATPKKLIACEKSTRNS